MYPAHYLVLAVMVGVTLASTVYDQADDKSNVHLRPMFVGKRLISPRVSEPALVTRYQLMLNLAIGCKFCPFFALNHGCF